MHAAVLHAFGPAENLRYETVPDPVPAAGQVRIAVEATGLHQVETVMRSGAAIEMAPPLPQLPTIFGGEVAGTVESMGPGVDEEWLGREVVTSAATSGGYAELAVADVTTLHRIPDGLDARTAVAMVVTGTTALGFLDTAELRPEDVVLATSAAGGIGRLVVQYARNLGATVIGAAGGPAKTEAVRALGADLAVDYNEPGWDRTVTDWLGGRRVTAVLDGVGGAKAREAYSTLADGGRFVSIGASSKEEFTPDPDEQERRGITVVSALLRMLSNQDAAAGLDVQRRALAAAAGGRLIPSVQEFPLSQAAAAHAAMERRETTGKVLLIP